VWLGPLVKRNPGGAERYILALAANSRHHPVVFGDRRELMWELRWAGRWVPIARHLYPFYVRFVRAFRIAHVHVLTEYADVLGAWPNVLPWVFTLHGISFEEPWAGRPDMLRYVHEYNESALRAVRSATLATVVSRWVRDYVEEHTPLSPPITPPGVDLVEFDASGPSGFLRHSGLQPGFLLWVGRLAREKGLDWYLRLAQQVPDKTFVVVTDRPAEEAYADYPLPWPPNLRYFAGLPRPLVVSAYHACAAHVITSKYEGASTTVIEAMACGKPVVVPDRFGPQEAVHDSGAGLAFDYRSPEDLLEKTRQVLDHPELGARGPPFVRDRRDWRKLTAFFDQEYEALASRR
jgi:glycosyltransferase involved in cell wall biosynthesis